MLQAFQECLVSLPDRWNILFTDFSYNNFDRNKLNGTRINLLYLEKEACCIMMNFENECSCPDNFVPEKEFLRIVLTISENISSALKSLRIEPLTDNCKSTVNDESYKEHFYDALSEQLEQHAAINNVRGNLKLILNGTVELEKQAVAQYRNEIVVEEGKQIKPIKAFYRVGTTYVSIHENTKKNTISHS